MSENMYVYNCTDSRYVKSVGERGTRMKENYISFTSKITEEK